MRTVLFHYIYDRPPENFSELHLGVPDEHMRVAARNVYVGLHDPPPNARIVKTHNPYQISRKYENVVYIVRDPRDVLPSYWKYLKRNRLGFDMDFEDFLRASMSGAIWPSSYFSHVRSWTEVGAQRIPNFAAIKYEDLRNSRPNATEDLARGLCLDDADRLHNLIASYDIERMRQLEDSSRPNASEVDQVDNDGRTVGSGKASDEMRKQVEASIAHFLSDAEDFFADCLRA